MAKIDHTPSHRINCILDKLGFYFSGHQLGISTPRIVKRLVAATCNDFREYHLVEIAFIYAVFCLQRIIDLYGRLVGTEPAEVGMASSF